MANFFLRTASRVLVPILTFKATDADEVYENVKALDWSKYMTLQTGFQIDATVYSDTFRHSRYVTYRVKDAIVDWWNEREGKRPNVKLSDPDLFLNVHIANETVTLSLDSSGESLHKRGYRVANTEAPINEALAAGMLLMAGWKGETDFYDPMCGSGTLLIEAALIAQNIAPGMQPISVSASTKPRILCHDRTGRVAYTIGCRPGGSGCPLSYIWAAVCGRFSSNAPQ